MLEFRELPEFPRYRIFNDGTVWSDKTIDKSWKQLVGKIDKDGYREFLLNPSPMNRKYVRGHRLVLLAFIGECPKGFASLHFNGVKGDNRLENLCWAPTKNKKENSLPKRVRIHKYKERICKKCLYKVSKFKGNGLCLRCYTNERYHLKIKTDPLKMAILLISNRLREILHTLNVGKNRRKTLELLGITKQSLKNRRDSFMGKPCCDGRLCDGETIINDKNSHCDHFKPLRLAKTFQDVIDLNQLENLRWICAPCNLSKNGKWDE